MKDINLFMNIESSDSFYQRHRTQNVFEFEEKVNLNYIILFK